MTSLTLRRNNMAYNDLTGRRFGKLIVLGRAPNDAHGNIMWHCKCDCGREKTTRVNALTSGKATSCGCIQRKRSAEAHTKHGGRRSRLYNIWSNMKGRCYVKSSSFYEIYGGRGITVCDEWRYSFETFRDWALANGYQDDLTLDRKDNDGPYCPENCRWATVKEQARNRTETVFFTVDGITKSRNDWAETLGMKPASLRAAIRRGHDPETYIRAKLKEKEITP